ncbi:caspase family protein [Endozoicomonas sp. Mp262]|uniref:caspase family protein n=1 Tax=Endozoicomonas sp. Mp262 TaxID=2919499 RepID=UPI0021DACC3E
MKYYDSISLKLFSIWWLCFFALDAWPTQPWFKAVPAYIARITPPSYLEAWLCSTALLKYQNRHKTLILLVAQNYTHSKYTNLKGCINDAINLRYFLKKMGYPEKNIRLITDEKQNITTEQVIDEIEQIANKTTRHWMDWNTVIIAFSGHGSSSKERKTSQEKDKRDELLVCGDGCISDNKLHELLKLFDRKCNVFFSFDTCHSATMLDLQYICRSEWNADTAEFRLKRDKNSKYSYIAANVVMISGCRDSQTSADALLQNPERRETRYFSRLNWSRQGAYTNTLLKLLKKSHANYKLLSLPLHLSESLHKRFKQRPVLSSSFYIPRYFQLFDW